ncbi:MAG: putative sugar nucleotidyl transferase [Candidatus Brocadiia bacterium]|nr:putative sugar nucleotidyl transferase [Candidatus Brocadiia bacterium]
MKVILFEDEHVGDLYPLTCVRPVFDLRCGVFTLKQKVERKFPGAALYLETRDELDGVAAERHGEGKVNSHEAVRADDDILLVTAGAILTGEPASYTAEEAVGVTGEGRFVWAFLKAETIQGLDAAAAIGIAQEALGTLATRAVDDVLIRHPWDLVARNAGQIIADYEDHYTAERKSTPLKGAAMIGPGENLYVGENVEIQPHTWIDCREGPVILSDGVTVTAHATIYGPCFVGEGAQLLAAIVRGGCSIGTGCSIGGEIEASILHANVEKRHAGFLGHSYVCEWVDIGALTASCDRTGDCGTVKLQVSGHPVDGGAAKLGSFIGDHARIGAGAILDAGSVVGILCDLAAGPGALPKFIPCFACCRGGRIAEGPGLSQSLETARMAMSRRGQELTEPLTDLIAQTEEITRQERTAEIEGGSSKLL